MLAVGVFPAASVRAFDPTSPAPVRVQGEAAEAIGAIASTESTAAATTAVRLVPVGRPAPSARGGDGDRDGEDRPLRQGCPRRSP